MPAPGVAGADAVPGLGSADGVGLHARWPRRTPRFVLMVLCSWSGSTQADVLSLLGATHTGTSFRADADAAPLL